MVPEIKIVLGTSCSTVSKFLFLHTHHIPGFHPILGFPQLHLDHIYFPLRMSKAYQTSSIFSSLTWISLIHLLNFLSSSTWTSLSLLVVTLWTSPSWIAPFKISFEYLKSHHIIPLKTISLWISAVMYKFLHSKITNLTLRIHMFNSSIIIRNSQQNIQIDITLARCRPFSVTTF